MCVEAIRRWEPRVKDVRATARAFDDQGRVDVLISFTIKATGERVTNREYPYYLGNQGAF
jgi:phage baseplate assembly protein W